MAASEAELETVQALRMGQDTSSGLSAARLGCFLACAYLLARQDSSLLANPFTADSCLGPPPLLHCVQVWKKAGVPPYTPPRNLGFQATLKA